VYSPIAALVSCAPALSNGLLLWDSRHLLTDLSSDGWRGLEHELGFAGDVLFIEGALWVVTAYVQIAYGKSSSITILFCYLNILQCFVASHCDCCYLSLVSGDEKLVDVIVIVELVGMVSVP
jgi:hypothetical protein